MKIKLISVVLAVIILAAGRTSAEAAYSYTSTETDAPSPVFTMKDTPVSVTFQIKNTSTSPNQDERIYLVRFRINTYGTVFLNTTTAPTGWTRTSFSTTSMTFQANTANDAIVCTTAGCVAGPTTSVNFTLIMTAGTSTLDVTQHLRDVRASFQNATSPWPPTTYDSRITLNSGASIGSWALRSLRVTSFQITDLVGTPINSITAGTSFKLVMTVRNDSSASQSTITTNPNPPTAVKTGTVTQGLTSTVYSPNPLTLAAGASGTITFTYSTNAGDSGTIYFTAFARNTTNVATSITATSPSLAVGKFTASLAVSTTPATSPTCGYFNTNLTVTMTLTNNYGNSITGVAASALVVSVPGQVTLTSGPTYPSGTTVTAGGTLPVTWIYQITAATYGASFTFSGTATGTEQTGGAGTPRTTPNSTSNTATYGGYTSTVNPATVNTNSLNQEISWTIPNTGCADVKQVQITIPAAWGSVTDTDSAIDQINPPNPGTEAVETWTVAGTTFTAPASPPNPYNLLALTSPTQKGIFYLVFSSTPAVTGASPFSITITDTNNTPVSVPAPVTVNSFNTGSPNPNFNDTDTIREDIR